MRAVWKGAVLAESDETIVVERDLDARTSTLAAGTRAVLSPAIVDQLRTKKGPR